MTRAPTSTISSGSTVPVALIVEDRSPRLTATVRKVGRRTGGHVRGVNRRAARHHADHDEHYQ